MVMVCTLLFRAGCLLSVLYEHPTTSGMSALQASFVVLLFLQALTETKVRSRTYILEEENMFPTPVTARWSWPWHWHCCPHCNLVYRATFRTWRSCLERYTAMSMFMLLLVQKDVLDSARRLTCWVRLTRVCLNVASLYKIVSQSVPGMATHIYPLDFVHH